MSIAPAFIVTQQASENAMSNGSSTLSSLCGSQSQTGHGLSQEFACNYVGGPLNSVFALNDPAGLCKCNVEQ